MDPTSSNRLSRVLASAAQGLEQIGQTRVQTALAMFQMRTEALKAQADADYKAQDLSLRKQTEADTANYRQSDLEERGKESAAKLADAQAKDKETQSYRQQTLAQGAERIGVERERIGADHSEAAAARQQNADTAKANALDTRMRTNDQRIAEISKQRAAVEKAVQTAQAGGTTQEIQQAKQALDAFDAAHKPALDKLNAENDALAAAYDKTTGLPAEGTVNAPMPKPTKSANSTQAATGVLKSLPVKQPGMIYTRKGKVMIWDGRSEKPYVPGQSYTDPSGNPLQLYKYDPNATTASPDNSIPQPDDATNAMDQASTQVASQGAQTDTQMGDQTGLGAQDMGNETAVGDQAVGAPDLSQGTAGQLAADPQLQQAPLMAQMGAENNQPS